MTAKEKIKFQKFSVGRMSRLQASKSQRDLVWYGVSFDASEVKNPFRGRSFLGRLFK